MGKRKYTQEQKQEIIARLTLGESPTKIAKDLKVPRGTVAYMKSNLQKIQEEDGSLGYHAEEKKKWVKNAWKAAQILIKKTLKAAETVEIRTPAHIKDTMSATKTILDRIDKIAPQPPQLMAGKERPLIDLSGAETKDLELIIARFKQRGKDERVEGEEIDVPPQLGDGEGIEGEFREINEELEEKGEENDN